MDAAARLRYIQARRELEKMNQRRILKEEGDYGYSGGGLFSIFKKPLEDVFSALKLSAMDLSNGLQRIFKAIWHLGDPKKLEKDKAEYDRKKAKIYEQWKKVYGDSLQAIKSADPFLMLGMAPAAFLAIESGRTNPGSGGWLCRSA